MRRRTELFYQKNPTSEKKLAYQQAILKYKEAFKRKKSMYFDRNVNKNINLRVKFANFNRLLGVPTEHKVPRNWGSIKTSVDRFQKFFRDKVLDIRELIPTSTDNGLNSLFLVDEFNHVTMSLDQFNSVELKNVREALIDTSNSFCVLDPVPTSVAKQTFVSWCDHFLNLANSSFERGTFPDFFKTAVIKPNLKKPNLDTELPRSYRPIANTLFFSKSLERLAADQLKEYLENYKLLDVQQSAYRAGHSTETCLIKTFNDILLQLNSNKKQLILGLDLSAAFDTIDHDIFGWVLENRFNIRGKCKSWIMSYISKRKQKVQIGNCLSAEEIVDFGVPQGSILGPLLFTMYVTPIGDLMKRIQLRYQVYADDTLILSTLRQQTLEHDIKDLDTKLSLLFQAFSQMKLRVNPDKTEVMLISSRKQKLNLAKLDLAGENLTLQPSFKSLGITIDQHFSLTRHINSVTASCYNELRKLYKIRHYLTIETRKLVVQNLIISRLDYCNSVLSGVPKAEIMKYQRVQNAACRFIFSLKKSESCKDFMYHLHWLPIDKRIDFKVLIFVHKFIHNCHVPDYLNHLVEIQPDQYRKRSVNAFKAVTVQSKNSYGDRAFCIRGPKLWNKLPQTLREISDQP